MIGYYSHMLLIFSLSFLALFFYSLTKQRNGLSGHFSMMCLAAAIYIGGYGFELQSDTPEAIVFFTKLEYFGIPFMSAFWLILSYKFLTKKSISVKVMILILIIPVITVFMCVTNEYHHLLYESVVYFEYNDYLLSSLDKGPWYYVNIAYAYTVQIFSFSVFFRGYLNSGNKSNKQAFYMLLGSIWPALINIIYVAGFSPLSLDPTPFALCISAVFFYIAIFKYGFLQLQEIVKDVTFLEISEGIIVIDEKNRILDFNSASKAIFSWLCIENIGEDMSVFPEGKGISSHKNEDFEMSLNHDGCIKYYEFKKTALKDNGKNFGYVYFIRDISEQKQMIEKLNSIANLDPLTEIYNRRKLLSETEKELSRSQRYNHCLSFLMVDIDHFKSVNDRFGHQTGDDVLKVVAKLLKERIRRTDIIGRYGGEEFLIILAETDIKRAYSAAEDLRNQIEETVINTKESEIKITVSIGIVTACGEDTSINVEKLIDCADIALYQAKDNGRNQCCIFDLH